MRLLVNGEEFDSKAATLGALIEELSIEPGRVAVEVNLKVVKRSDYPGTRLNEGDSVEIVNFVGGG